MPNLPLPPSGAVISRDGGEDALAITFLSSVNADTMAGYYRHVLTTGDWNLVSDTKDAKGIVTMYAERPGPSLWVRITTDSATKGSIVILAGAKAPLDSAAMKRDSAAR